MHMHRWVALVAVASFLAGPLAAGAAHRDRDPPSTPVAVGDRVQVFLRDGRDGPVIGEVVELDQQGVVVRLEDHRDRRMDWRSVSSVWISRGRRSDIKGGAVNGAVVGGVGLGLAGTFLVPCIPLGHESRDGGGCLLIYGARGFAIGALVGGLLGATIGEIETERWKRVKRPEPQISVGLTPQRGGFGAAVALQF
jgi:hypothetical protein